MKTPMMSEAFTPSSRYSVIPNKRKLKMRSPRPVEGRARNLGHQGPWSDSYLGPHVGGFKQSISIASVGISISLTTREWSQATVIQLSLTSPIPRSALHWPKTSHPSIPHVRHHMLFTRTISPHTDCSVV